MKIVAIVQARMGSTRLPNKVMMKINGVPMIELLFNRLSKSKNINQKNKNKPLECLAVKCSSIFDETYKIKILYLLLLFFTKDMLQTPCLIGL